MRRSALVLAIVGAGISATGFAGSVLVYMGYRDVVETVGAFAPLEKDYVAEVLAPLVAGQPKAKPALDLVRARLEENRIFHKGWLELARSSLGTARIQCFLWGGVLLVFLALAIAVWPPRAAADNAV
ncbi:MAG TPA: hypothetical protein VIW78_00010 [Burkholderiales bacterium]